MIDDSRPIFRPESLQRHAQARTSAALPSLASPRSLIGLWMLLGLLLAGGVSTLFLQIPDYVSGTAWIADRQGDAQSAEGAGIRVVAVFTPQQGRKLRPGQILHLSAAGSVVELTGPITTVESNLSSPESIRRRFNLSSANSSVINGPSAVVFARVTIPQGAVPGGSVYRVRVLIGAKRIVSALRR